MKFKKVFDTYQKYMISKLKAQSIRTVTSRFETNILPFFKNYNIYNIKEIDIINWQNEIESKKLIKSFYIIVHTIFLVFISPYSNEMFL